MIPESKASLLSRVHERTVPKGTAGGLGSHAVAMPLHCRAGERKTHTAEGDFQYARQPDDFHHHPFLVGVFMHCIERRCAKNGVQNIPYGYRVAAEGQRENHQKEQRAACSDAV